MSDSTDGADKSKGPRTSSTDLPTVEMKQIKLEQGVTLPPGQVAGIADGSRTAMVERPDSLKPSVAPTANDGQTMIVPREELAALEKGAARDGKTAMASTIPIDPKSIPNMPDAKGGDARTSGAAPGGDAKAPSEDDHGLAKKIQGIMQARSVEKGEVNVVKLADIIRIVREMLGSFAGKGEQALQDELVKLKLQLEQAGKGGGSAEDKARAEALAKELEAMKAQLEAMRQELERAKAEAERLAAERDGLRAERDAMRGELDRARLEQAELLRARDAAISERDAAERARAELQAKLQKVEDLLGMSGKSLEELQSETEGLRGLINKLEEEARSKRSEVRYAALVEDPPFAEEAGAAAAIEGATKGASPNVGGSARAAVEVVRRAVKDEARWKKLVDDVHARKATTEVVARLETMSAVHHALRGEMARWQKALE